MGVIKMNDGDCNEFSVVIAGGRDYDDYDNAKAFINECLKMSCVKSKIVVLSGGAKGADALGERYAKENGFKIERHAADWKRYGRGAGPRRNAEMAKKCDMLICFWDGESRGSKSMIEFAEKYGKKVFIKKI